MFINHIDFIYPCVTTWGVGRSVAYTGYDARVEEKAVEGDVESFTVANAGLTVYNGGKSITSGSVSKYRYAVVGTNYNSPAEEGSWSFTIDEDKDGDERVIVGFTTNPELKAGEKYTQDCLFFYRGYNQCVYSGGKKGRKIVAADKGDIVKFTLDEGDVSISIRGQDQGVCFKGVEGEIWPFVGTYGKKRAVTLSDIFVGAIEAPMHGE